MKGKAPQEGPLRWGHRMTPLPPDVLKVELSLITALASLFATDDIDLTLLNEAPYRIRFAVARDGVLLFARDDQARINFVADAIRDYLDFKPFQSTYFATMWQSIREEGLSH